ncbi:MAG: ComEC family competence protein [Paludibacter sp.]|nr:ComEC family competence protein [Paludibacter sp.]
MDFLQRTPFFRLLLPLIIGIVLYQYVELYTWSQYALLCLSGSLILLGFIIQKPKLQFQFRWLFGCGIFLFIMVIGYFVSARFDNRHSFQNIDKQGVFSVELTEMPIEKENSFLCRVKKIDFFDSIQTSPTKGKALLYIQKDSAAMLLSSGDRLLVETKFNKPDGALNPEGFNYAAYLNRQGIVATSYIQSSDWKRIGKNTSFSIFRLAEKSQRNLLDIYKRFGIVGDEFAVLAALTLGSKDALHPELRQNYTTSGGMHILAVSGLHVGIIYMVLGFLFAFLDKKPRLKIPKAVLIVMLLWLYAFITGLPPSVVRATLMFSFIAIGASLDRKSQIYNTISASALIMLLYNPNYLFDVGFQLSFSAVVSIVYFQPKIKKWVVTNNKALSWMWDLTSVSLAAQIGTAPFSLFYFHQFANYFIITNFIAIPFATFIIYGAVILFVFSPVPYFSVFVAFILQWLLRILNYSIGFIHDLPFSLSITSISFWELTCIFSILILFTFYTQTKKFLSFFAALVIILILLTINLSRQYDSLANLKMIVYADNKNTHIDFIDGMKHYLFTTDSSSVERIAGNFWLKNKLDKPIRLTNYNLTSDGFIEFKGNRILILTANQFKNKTTIHPISIDYLIIGNALKPKIAEILGCITPRKIIVDKSISGWYAKEIRKICAERGIPYYSVADQGAYILSFIH